MFTIPRPNVVMSDEGFSVEILGRTGVRYEDNIGSVTVDGEMLVGPSGFMIYRDSIKSTLPIPAAPLNNARQDEIIKNIQRAFAFRGFDIEIY